MPLEVTWELHGEPLAPKMHSGRENIKFDFLPPPSGDHFWDMLEKILEKNYLLLLSLLFICLMINRWKIEYVIHT